MKAHPPRYARLADLCTLICDGTHLSPKLVDTGRPYLTSRNVRRGVLDTNEVWSIAEKDHRVIYNRCPTVHGDIWLTKDGANCGNAALNTFTKEVSLLSSVAVIRPNPDKLDTQYLLEWILSDAGQTATAGKARGLAITRVTLAMIRDMRVPVPPLAAQRKIGSVGERTLVADQTLDALIAAKREQKRGLMQQLLTGKVRFPGFTEPWKTVRLGDVADVRFSNVDKHTIPGERQVRLCNYTDVFRNRFLHPDMDFMSASATAREIENFGLQVGDVAITKDSETPDEIGVPALIDRTAPDLVLGYHLALLRADRARLDPGFLLILMESDLVRAHFQRRAKGLTRFALSIGAVADTPISLPKLGEQTKIAKIYRDITMEESLLKAQRASFVTQRHGLMERLLSGDILIPSSNTSAA